ncbi:peptidoglycan-binding domain-containing protein [Aureispira anguillae]|uniref:Peptidoglycan-binding protein n=1 Tax=Aureispira anguillae TaxID=2864201 RepID=A0A915YDW3_9BACT|nr:peptidoglycan-binding domain-containing protein [Aureispira anguillae]BDS11312.1 peptidoglycan-binding protein [Aureispira anguillae]
MNFKFITILNFLFLFGGVLQAQDNLESLLGMVETGKTYALYKAKPSDKKVIKEKQTHYLKLVPPKYKTIFDTIELAPALNGNLDTSNYFIQTEVLVLKEPGAEWKTARVSPLCRENDGVPHLALCLIKTIPDYQIIHRKFFPFKNIFDVSTTDYIIPAETVVVERKVLVQQAGIYYVTAEQKNNIGPEEKLVTIPAGKWKYWEEITCPYGEFNDPSITDIQEALKKQQYEVRVTGKFDEQTKRFLMLFQQDNMLEEGGITPETLQRLGVKREKLITIEF